MQIKTLTVGPLQTNCYLLTDEHSQQTIIIDPGDEADFITTTILENKLKPIAILLTHGHYDHCLGVLELQLNFNIPIYLHQNDLPLYQEAHSSAKHFSNIKIPALPAVKSYLEDNQTVFFGESTLRVIHTSGHTPGSCCFLVSLSEIRNMESGIYLFTGDTLFATGPGKADHSYSSKSDLQKSLHYLQSTIQGLRSTIYIYPGHEDWGFIAPPSLF